MDNRLRSNLCKAAAPVLLVAMTLLNSCQSTLEVSDEAQASSTASPEKNADSSIIRAPSPEDTAPLDYPGLPNVVAYHKNFYCGGVPEGEEGFDELDKLGVKTIISVDGEVPDVEMAQEHGMRYIHLPIGYDGFGLERQLQLTRAARDAMEEGPVYLHCHHGKHRSAGASGTIAVSLGWATPDEMIERMHVSGTSPSYTGLFACTANAVEIPEALIDRVSPDFPSASLPKGLTKGMVEVSHTFENLKAINKASWSAPKDHPDLVPASEAGQLADLLRHLQSDEVVKQKPAEFTEMFDSCWTEAQQLEDMIVEGRSEPSVLTSQFDRLASTCSQCHHKYRD